MLRIVFGLLVAGLLVSPSVAQPPASDQERALHNNACARLALEIVTGVHDDTESPKEELIRLCNSNPVGSVCRAAIDMIEENGKKSPLKCRSSDY